MAKKKLKLLETEPSKPEVESNPEEKQKEPTEVNFCMSSEEALDLDRILAINDQARKIGTLDYAAAYRAVVTFVTTNLKKSE